MIRSYLRQLNCMVFGHDDETLCAGDIPIVVSCSLCGDEAPASMQPPAHSLLTPAGFAKFQAAMEDVARSILTALVPAFAQLSETAQTMTGCIEKAIIGWGSPEYHDSTDYKDEYR